jgi:4-hydroxythreonine-4-phosphate dehydrogenase
MPTPSTPPSVTSAKPRLAVLLGDPSGVGPEMAVKLLARRRNLDAARVLLIADPVVLAAGERVAGTKLDALRVDSLDAVRFEDGRPTLLACDWMGGQEAALGESNEQSGRASFEALELATLAVRRGQAEGILFAPLNKHSLRLGGLVHEDELRYMQERFAVTGFVCEFNLTGSLWTSRVTSHIPLKDVASHMADGVRDAVKIIAAALRRAGVAQPRIAVTGLNPHAGDGGSIGMEEIEIIAPAIAQLRAEGYDACGPFSPDTVFIGARRGDVDAVVSMYHDQGQIAMKGLRAGRDAARRPAGAGGHVGQRQRLRHRGPRHRDHRRPAADLCVRMAGGAPVPARARGHYYCDDGYGCWLRRCGRGGRVQPRGVARRQARRDVLGQHLAQLHAPLVEAVDAPQGAGAEHAVLVQRDSAPRLAGSSAVQQQHGAGPVAREVLVAARVALAQHQRLRLRQHVGQQLRVVFGQRVRGLAHGDEFHRHHVGALVQHLEVGVLAVGARLAPDHRRGGEGQHAALPVDALAVALHLELLQVGRQPAQRAVVRRHAAAGEAVEVAVPDVQQRQPHRQVASSGAVRKCWSIAWAPASRSRKPAAPTAMAIGRPMADHSE